MAADRGVYLEFADFGVATAYVNLAFGAFAQETAHVGGLSWDARVLQLIGQSDLAVSVAADEFRKLLGGPYPNRDSQAFSLNWNFTVPYLFGAPEDPTRWIAAQGGSKAAEDAPLHFFQHLRLRRSIFAYADAEVQIIHALRGLLHANGIDAAILAGLGWSDIILDGRINVDQMADFTRFLMKTHELHLPLDHVPPRRLPVFQRILTLFGYVPGAVPSTAGLRHLTFVRTVPGQLAQAREALRAEFPTPLYDIAFIDGKSDFVLGLAAQPALPLLGSGYTAPGDATLFQRQERLTVADGDATIQRLESHLLLTDVDAITVEPDAGAVWPAPRPARHCDCACAAHQFDLETVKRPFGALPIGLQQAINNLLLLFTAALKDPTTCCDSFPAIAACEKSLVTLLESFDNVLKDLPTTAPMTKEQLKQLGLDEAFASLNAQMDEMTRFAALYPRGIKVNELLSERYRYMEDWHLYAERMLSQRIVGSFEAMLGHTDRVTTYRGGAQKFLHLADGLVRDFTGLIPKVDRLAFTTLYDSVHTIVGMRGGHFIRIPVRHVFTLPLGVADLWHEVGVAIFNLRYDPKLVADVAATLAIDADVLYENLGDTYGDFVVFLFGFRGNFIRFADSLLKGWYDSQVPGGILIPQEVLTRLYLVLELAFARKAGRTKGDGLLPNPMVLLLLRYLRAIVERRYDAYKDLLSADENLTWLTLAHRLVHRDFRVFRARTHDFLDAAIPPSHCPSLKDIMKGRTVELGPDVDINALFADYVATVNDPAYVATLKRQSKGAKRSQMFRSMAALGKSASQAYMQRFATPAA